MQTQLDALNQAQMIIASRKEQGVNIQLNSLTVDGLASFNNVTTKQITSNTDGNILTINGRGIEGAGSVSVATGSQNVFEADSRQIVIGNIQNTTRPVKVFGALSVGINNPDPSVNFAVGGDVSIGGKKFTNGTSVPTSGIFATGDICWNTAPTRGGFVGWICIVGGNPGEWSPFGAIVAQ
jgi:hypothetical protein